MCVWGGGGGGGGPSGGYNLNAEQVLTLPPANQTAKRYLSSLISNDIMKPCLGPHSSVVYNTLTVLSCRPSVIDSEITSAVLKNVLIQCKILLYSYTVTRGEPIMPALK